MRIGSYNSTMRYQGSINRTYENQTKLMEMSDGDRIHRPSRTRRMARIPTPICEPSRAR